jgi:signal transduction histidine kinase/ActR/RegA family two-component response regulator
MRTSLLIYGMIYGGSALMLYNIIRYVLFQRYAQQISGWERENQILYIPLFLLVLFLLGYLTVGLFGQPDLIVAGILFGGSVFVFLMVRLMRGITEHIRQNERLHAALHEAEQASAAKSNFLSNMSHDIRTPMNAIIGYVNLSKREDITLPELKGFLDKIESSSQHLLSLINDVLEMSHIESGKLELTEAPADLTAVLEETCSLFATQMEEKGLQYTVKCDVTDRSVSIDQNRLSRMLLNLISNAYKFTPEGGRVTVSLNQTGSEAETGTYEFRVQDTGIGMSPEFAERVFDAFERERNATVSGIQGTGLGMAITKSIVDLMGGEIQVHTAPGEGTEFLVRLTFRRCSESALTQREATGPCRLEEQLRSGLRLLLVEDMEINREIAIMLLQERGFLVEVAENGLVAVEKVSASPGYYDAILMDIQMPVMDGYTAARTIRALDDPAAAGVPIIAVTANAFNEDVQRALEAGMDGHIAKPIDPQQMAETLCRVLDANRKRTGV